MTLSFEEFRQMLPSIRFYALMSRRKCKAIQVKAGTDAHHRTCSTTLTIPISLISDTKLNV